QGGSVELHEATLDEPGPTSPNLLLNGGFEELGRDFWPLHWSQPQKYRYFPPGVYYIFNTWHNSNSSNRGEELFLTGVTPLVPHKGKNSLCMVVPAGDEVRVISDAINLAQKEARLIEVRAWVKTDQLCMMQIDAEDDRGQRLDCFNFIHKNPLSIGTD